MTRERLKSARRWVIKIGSSLLTADGKGLDRQRIGQWCGQIADLVNNGHEVVLVSSGAIAEGMSRLNLNARPHDLPTLQAAAAVGQMGLIQTYEAAFDVHALRTAQVLLTHEDLSNRQRYLNARATLRRLLELKTVPVVNENDTVTTDEIRFGDNDSLGAMVANLIAADVLVILTDQQGLFTDDPRANTQAELIERADPNDENILALAGATGSQIGSGGMRTKVLAARRAADSGTTTVLAHGKVENVISELRQGARIGTMFTSSQPPKLARKQWLASQIKSNGRLQLDSGAASALQQRGVSLLAVGVSQVEGNFKRGELVSCLDEEGTEIARGLSNYDSDASRRIAGHTTDQFESILGYIGEPELINRDNLVLTAPSQRSEKAITAKTGTTENGG